MSDPVQITDKIQWHPGFDGGIELALRKYKKELTYHREYQLSKKPLQIDVLIVKKRSDSVIDTPIGKIFSVHNIVEYKYPTDYVNIDDFYKTFGYACLYKALGKHVNDIPGDQLTVSIFQDSYPVELVKELKRLGFSVEKRYQGIYYVTGLLGIPAQIVVSDELADPDSVALRVLSNKATEEDVREFTKMIRNLKDKDDMENADAVFQVSRAANRNVYDALKGRDPQMFEAMMDFMKPEIDAKIDEMIDQNKLESIKNIMDSLKMTPQQAMDALKIPVTEQSKYQSRL